MKGRITDILKKHLPEIKTRFRIKNIGVFGSQIRGEANKKSDIDILVEFENGYKTFDNYMDLKFYLEELLGSNVDLVLKDALKEELKPHILSEVVYA